MSADPPVRPLGRLPVAAAPGSEPPRHETILAAEPPVIRDALTAASSAPDEKARVAHLRRIAAEHPATLEAWARLSEASLGSGDAVQAYAFARVAYHRGLDRLRREGWGGTGLVRWSQASNRGFLRGLHALLAAAAALGEVEESARCREFLLTLDPDDGLRVAGYPPVPGPDWVPPAI
ncbi:MAG: DUF3151 family protein [Candidatus Dormibacteria bacterium]